MTAKTRQNVHPYSVRIRTATGKSAAVPLTLMTPKQVEEVQGEFKKLAHDAGVKGARSRRALCFYILLQRSKSKYRTKDERVRITETAEATQS